jgi:hypothetical protein
MARDKIGRMGPPKADSAGHAVRLFAELIELDRQSRARRQTLSFQQKQRRAQISHELRQWARGRLKTPPGGEHRRDPRVKLPIRVQLIGGPRPLELQSDSLGLGGLGLTLTFTVRVGDLLALRLIPPAGETDDRVDVQAEVIWFDAARLRAGMQFRDLSEEATALVERLVFSDLVSSP